MNYFNANFLKNNELKKINFKKIGKNVLISRHTVIIGAENISLGDNVRIDPFCFLLCPKGFISVGKFTHISSHVLIGGHGGVKIGKFCGLGSGTKLYSSSESYTGEGLSNLNLSLNKKISKKFQKFDIGKITVNDHTNIGANNVIFVFNPLNCTVLTVRFNIFLSRNIILF